ncbi:MAG: hypothetical protein ACK4X1_17610 [Terricaulis sp.]
MLAKMKPQLSDTGLDVAVVERKDSPGVWSVEAIGNASDGEVYLTLFSGPDAHERAREYAQLKYGA